MRVTGTKTQTTAPEAIALAKAERAKRAKTTKATPAPEATATTPKAATPAIEAKPKQEQKGGETVLRTGKLSARGLPCLCGCGAATHTKDARFLSGHDAKLRKVLLLQGAEAMPEVIAPFFARGEEIAGLTIEDGEVIDHKPQMAR